MTSGWTFLAITALICIGAFLNGVRFARMKTNPWAGKRVLGQPVAGHDMPLARVRLLGWLQIIAAPMLLLIFAAIAFGLLGPIDGIDIISLH